MMVSTTNPSLHPAPDSATRRRPRAGSDEVRARLIDAALIEFAAHGFEGASTRAIATRAGAHQPQINYHFESKDELWKATIILLMDELDDLVDAVNADTPRESFAGFIRAMVHLAATRPELNRIMIHEATSPSERLTWLVESQLRARTTPMLALWDHLLETGEAAAVPRPLVYHLLIGAASLLHANAPEARLLLQIEPTDSAMVEAHADAMVALFLPPKGP
jgi:TetR/AcrR family transcriptional regulator